MRVSWFMLVLLVSGNPLPLRCADNAEPEMRGNGFGIRRIANMPDGAPAFELRNVEGALVSRIECISNGWYEADELSARLLGSREFMAVLIAKNARLDVTEVGPASFNCVVVDLEPPSQRAFGKKAD